MVPTAVLAPTAAPVASVPAPATTAPAAPAPVPPPQVSISVPPASAPPPWASTPTPPAPDASREPTNPELSSCARPKKLGPKPRRASASSPHEATEPGATASESPCSQLRGALGQVVTARLFPDSPSPSEVESQKARATPPQAKGPRPPSQSRRESRTESRPAAAASSPGRSVLRKSKAALSAEAGDPQAATTPEAFPLSEVPTPEFKRSAPKTGAGDAWPAAPPASGPAPSEDLLAQAARLLQAAEGEGDPWALGYLDGGTKPCGHLLKPSLTCRRLGWQRVSGRPCAASAKNSEGRAPAAEKESGCAVVSPVDPHCTPRIFLSNRFASQGSRKAAEEGRSLL